MAGRITGLASSSLRASVIEVGSGRILQAAHCSDVMRAGSCSAGRPGSSSRVIPSRPHRIRDPRDRYGFALASDTLYSMLNDSSSRW